MEYWHATCWCGLWTSARRPLYTVELLCELDWSYWYLPSKNELGEDIITSSNTANLLPHLHALVDDTASDLDGQQWAQLTATLQRNVYMFICPANLMSHTWYTDTVHEIVAPDRFPSGDVCLGVVRACSPVTTKFPVVWWRGHARTCARGVGLKLLRKADVLWIQRV